MDALAAARSAVQPVVAEPVRSAAVARIRYVAADDSSPVGADSVADDLPAERSAAPSKDVPPARVALLADSCPDGCMPAAHYSAPAGSAVQRVAVRCAPAALQDGYPACYSKMVGSAADDGPDWADSVLADLAQVDSPQADSVPVDWAAACYSADLFPADCLVAQTVDDRYVPVARMDGWIPAVDDSPVDSPPADLVADGCQVGSAPADCSAFQALVLAVPRVRSFQGVHSQADLPASRLADSLDDSWPQAVAPASPGEQSLLAARTQADLPHASAAFVDALPALPDCVAAPAASPRTMVPTVAECSSRSRDGSQLPAEERRPGLRCSRAHQALLAAREEPRPAS